MSTYVSKPQIFVEQATGREYTLEGALARVDQVLGEVGRDLEGFFQDLVGQIVPRGSGNLQQSLVDSLEVNVVNGCLEVRFGTDVEYAQYVDARTPFMEKLEEGMKTKLRELLAEKGAHLQGSGF